MSILSATRRMAAARSSRLDLHGRVALVTGAGDGIGFETARALAAHGALVVIVDRDEVAAKAAAAEIGDHRALAIVADVTDREGMRLAVARTLDHFGRLDVVVANAAITPPSVMLRQLDPGEFEKVLQVNVTGVLNTVHPAVDALIAARGHIVVVASAAAFSPPVAGAAYMASKAAVEVLARGFRLELAVHEVTVTTSYFGVVETRMARATLDESAAGRELDGLLPALMRRRISASDAARTIVRAIERRSAHSMAPLAWEPYSLLRGMVNPMLDSYLSTSPDIHALVLRAESRHLVEEG